MTPVNEPAVELIESGESTVDRFVIRPLLEMWDRVVEHTPSIATAIIVLLILWLVARIARGSVTRVLGMSKVDRLLRDTRLERIMSSFQDGFTLSRAVAYFVYVAILVVAWMTAADIVGLPAVRNVFVSVLGYLPKLGAALLVFAIGGYIASSARKAVAAAFSEVKSSYAHALEGLTEFLLLILVATIALDTLGANMTLITSNITLLLGAATLTLVLLFIWSMRRPAEEIIANYYLRRMVSIGDQIVLNEEAGTIMAFTPLGVLVRDPQEDERFIPARHLLEGLRCTQRARPVAVESTE